MVAKSTANVQTAAERTTESVRIRAVQTGLVRVRRRQLHGEGPGVLRVPLTFIDREWGEWLPIYAWVIEHPERITVARIDAETNAEVRRVMIERYKRGESVRGAARYMLDGGARKLDHDEAYGTLHYRDVPDDEPIVILEMRNRTPEVDGTFKHYYERVPPTMRTAKEAHNWRRGFRPGVTLTAQES